MHVTPSFSTAKSNSCTNTCSDCQRREPSSISEIIILEHTFKQDSTMAIDGIDTVTGGRRRRILRAARKGEKQSGARGRAEDFPLFYRTRESMVIDEAICASLGQLDGDVHGSNGLDKQEEGVSTPECIVKGKELSNNEIETIQKVVNDVDDMVRKIMNERFKESIFTCGVLNCFLIAFVFFVCPENFWVLYLVEMIFLVPLNQYHRCKAKPLNKSLYYLDFCWVANLIAIASLLTIVVHPIIVNAVSGDFVVLPDSARKQLFMAVLGTSCGPLLAATGVLPYIALLFHDLDCMTGLFIHILPPMEAYTLRWHALAIKAAWPNHFHLNYLESVHFFPLNDGIIAKIRHLPSTVAGNALILYVIWFFFYISWMLYFGLDLPRKDRKGIVPKYDTCFHSFMRGGACIAIGRIIWGRPRGVSLKQIESNHFERRDVFVHMVYHACSTLASIFILGYACYSSQIVHGAALIIMTAIAVKRGAHRYSYYSTSLYSTTLQKHFNILLPSASSHLIEKNDEVDVDPNEELDCLEYQLRSQVSSLRTRIGLVCNYFITRGDSVSTKDAHSVEGIFRRIFASFLKMFQPSDFRDLDTYAAFVHIVEKLRRLGDHNNPSIAKRANSIFNQPLDRHGNTALHLLIKKRQIKFTKKMLLNCGDTSFLDVNKPNAAGQTPLDFAVDRLEVETVYLLHLCGAAKTTSHVPVSNSLGYFEWILTDLIANLDTGRTLNRASIVAIMDKVFDSNLPTKELLAWAYGHSDGELTDEMIVSLGNLPQLYGLVLADGCDAITSHESFATLIRFLFSVHLDSHTYSDPNNLVEDEAGALPGVEDLPTPKVCNDLHTFLEDHDVDLTSRRVAGRTLFFSCRGSDTKSYALKLAKSFEEDKRPHPLAKEAAMDSSMATLKHRLDLVSDYPSRSELIAIKDLPREFREAVEGQRSKGFHLFEVSNKPEGITALLYCPPEGYEKYANDPTLSLEECQSGIFKAAFDYSRLAASGLMHGTLIDIQHDAREGRPHLWSFESFLTRFRGGAGRIARGFAGLAAPNVRVSGLADLKHTLTKAQVIARYDPSHIHAQHNLLYDPRERFQVSLIEQLGAGLFATSLLIASSWEGRHRLGIEPNLDLPNALEEGFVQFLQGYLQVSPERAKQLLRLMGTSFNLMANQIKVFATAEYVEIAERAPARPYFGIIAKILGKLTHPTAFVHFMQRGDRDLTKSGCSLEEIRSAYQLPPRDDGSRIIPEGYPRVDTSMMRCSPTWIKGHGWMNEKGQPHFGSYEGVLPFQQLIRDIYAVVHLASLILLSNIADDDVGVSVESNLFCKDGGDRAQ